MAALPEIGTPGWFVLDAAAHTAGTKISATVIDYVPGGPDTVTVLTYEDGGIPIPYGPRPVGSYTQNSAPVGVTVDAAGYYFIIADSIELAQDSADAAQVTANLGVAAAAASANAAANDKTPLQLIAVIPDQFSYADVIDGWHERFGNETIEFFFSAPLSVVSYKVVVKDVNDVSGKISINVAKSVRVSAPSTPTYVNIGSGLATAGNGTVQNVVISLSASNGESLHRMQINTGATNGGIALADQYQVLQIHPEV